MPHDVASAQDSKRQQFAALPLMKCGGETLVLLITSRQTRRWVLPKGWAEPSLTGSQLAAKEAFEEAGIVGKVAVEPVGSYTYRKRLSEESTVECLVEVFPLHVAKLRRRWPEQEQRKRRWFTLAQASEAVEEGELGALLLRLVAPET